MLGVERTDKGVKMWAEYFVERIRQIGIETLAGIPDSALKPFCDYINREGKGIFRHYVPANEGAAVGIAIGNYLATGKPACLYMQNSGLGNIVNPITSLANQEVYGIPILMLIGWRGEPGKKDEPQHRFMGEQTEQILKDLAVEYSILDKDMGDVAFDAAIECATKVLREKRQYAFVIKRDFFESAAKNVYHNGNQLIREEVIAEIISAIGEKDVLVSTTGKISREVYEQSDRLRGNHVQDFLTVGGMGHASMIAFGIAEAQPQKRVYCLDGDGAILMHMGSMAFLAEQKPDNYVHICLNNGAHESVGGMPTGSPDTEFYKVAESCGYTAVYKAENLSQLREALEQIRIKEQLTFLEIKVAMQSRGDLGRPKESAAENKKSFMNYHGVKEWGESE